MRALVTSGPQPGNHTLHQSYIVYVHTYSTDLHLVLFQSDPLLAFEFTMVPTTVGTSIPADTLHVR